MSIRSIVHVKALKDGEIWPHSTQTLTRVLTI